MLDLLSDVQLTTAKIDRVPGKPEQLSFAQAEDEDQDVGRGVVAGHVVACRFQVVWLLRSEDGQTVIFGEVLVVFEVQGGERDFVGEAAGRDPHVVDRAGSPASGGCCG